jgi:hypothetical protein
MKTSCFKGYIALLLIAGMSLISAFRVAGTAGNIPYIYFYSQGAQAFIVQQADGNMPFILAEYEMPERHTDIMGAGWSHTGDWFSWTSRRSGGFEDSANIFVVGADGGEVLEVFQASLGVNDAILYQAWSPLNGHLLIITTPTTNNLVVYDPSSQQIVFSLQAEEFNPESLETIFTASWSPNGDYLAIHESLSNRLVLVETRTWEIVQSFEAGGSNTPYSGVSPQWLSANQLAYLSTDQTSLLINTVGDDRQTIISLPSGNLESLFLSPDGRYGLIYIGNNNLAGTYSLYTVSFETLEITLISDSAVLPISRLTTLSDNDSFWSGNWAFFREETGDLYVVNVITGESRRVPVEANGAFVNPTWDEQGQLLYYHNDQILQYSPESGAISQYERLPDDGNLHESLSAALIGTQMQITDIEFGSFVGAMHFRLHPIYYDWAFLISDRINSLHLINIVNLQTGEQYELGLCPLDSPACYGWLPSSVSNK